MASKETGGVVLAMGGFVFLVLAVKGTWSKVWHDLFQGSTPADTGSANPSNWPAAGASVGGLTFPGFHIGTGAGGKQYLIPNNPNGATTPVTPPASYPMNPPGTPGGSPLTGASMF